MGDGIRGGGMPWGGLPTPKAEQDPPWGHAIRVHPSALILAARKKLHFGPNPHLMVALDPLLGGGGWPAPLRLRGSQLKDHQGLSSPPSILGHPPCPACIFAGGLNPQT